MSSNSNHNSFDLMIYHQDFEGITNAIEYGQISINYRVTGVNENILEILMQAGLQKIPMNFLYFLVSKKYEISIKQYYRLLCHYIQCISENSIKICEYIIKLGVYQHVIDLNRIHNTPEYTNNGYGWENNIPMFEALLKIFPRKPINDDLYKQLIQILIKYGAKINEQ